MYLYLNTTSPEKIVLALLNKQSEILQFKNIYAKYKHSEKLLANIYKIFKDGGYKTSQLAGVLVVSGPGSFTALRIGVATVNALAWSLNIPILSISNKNNLDDKKLLDKNFKKILNKTKFTQQVLPKYGKQPNITFSKK
mgnify:CR=1 FL=1